MIATKRIHRPQLQKQYHVSNYLFAFEKIFGFSANLNITAVSNRLTIQSRSLWSVITACVALLLSISKEQTLRYYVETFWKRFDMELCIFYALGIEKNNTSASISNMTIHAFRFFSSEKPESVNDLGKLCFFVHWLCSQRKSEEKTTKKQVSIIFCHFSNR